MSAQGTQDGGTASVVLLDGTGRVLEANAAASALFGAEPGSLVGQNLFADIAPALRVPAFLGRFLDGVRSGQLDEEFLFTLGGETGAIELAVGLSLGTAPGTYAVTLGLRKSFVPSRQREAMLAVDLRASALPVDPLVCEQEPIHIPGTIQSQGALLAIGQESLTISVVSENLAELLGLGRETTIGRRLDELLPPTFVGEVQRKAAEWREGETPSRFTTELGDPARTYSVAVHRRGERVLVEFELAPTRPDDFGVPNNAAIRAAVRELRDAETFDALVEAGARHIRALTGFERVLVYRFDEDWNGEAVAESIVPDWADSLAGLRFPASDIPRQARDLYRFAPFRFVVDRDAAPVQLMASAADNAPVDLSSALFRSLSPIHLEYQRNLGVNGSMSGAITIGGRLWGLVIGHHRRPHYVAAETRDAVAIVTESLALRLHDLQTASLAGRRNQYLSVEQRLLGAMAASEDFVDALTNGGQKLTDLFGATGAAVVTGDRAVTVGSAPSADEVAALAGLIRRTVPDGETSFASDRLAADYPPADAYREAASGALAAFVDAGREQMILWFRPEVVSTVVWSGDPNKPVLADSASAAVLPRRSFERWVEERRGFSEPWAAWEVELGVALARAVEGVALRQSRRFTELSRKQDELLAALDQKDALIAQKDLLTREIDHRVKNSLQIVSAFVSMQSRHLKDPAAQRAFHETYGRVMSIARVHDSLYQSEDLQQVDLGQTIENLCRDLAGMEGERRELELRAEPGLMVPYRKAVALCLIATELVTNAWKYAYPDKPTGFVEVLVKRQDAERVTLRVRDQGAGLPEDWESRPRRGLGMQLIRAMLSQINATMQVDREDGASFTVTC